MWWSNGQRLGSKRECHIKSGLVMLPILYSLAIFEFEFVGFGVSKYVGVSMQSIYVAPVKSKGFAEF